MEKTFILIKTFKFFFLKKITNGDLNTNNKNNTFLHSQFQIIQQMSILN